MSWFKLLWSTLRLLLFNDLVLLFFFCKYFKRSFFASTTYFFSFQSLKSHSPFFLSSLPHFLRVWICISLLLLFRLPLLDLDMMVPKLDFDNKKSNIVEPRGAPFGPSFISCLKYKLIN